MKSSSAEGEDDAFAHASQAKHLAARKVGWRRLNGADDKRVANAQPLGCG